MYGHYAHELRKVSIELPWFAVLASVHRTATVSSFDPQKKVRIELQTVAVLWTLFKTAIYGCCAQVFSLQAAVLVISKQIEFSDIFRYWTFYEDTTVMITDASTLHTANKLV